jgi:uncharacterized RDD family membrane protein YckC
VPPPASRVQPPPLSPGGHRLAEFGDRLGAFIIDGLILGAISLVLLLPLYLYMFFNVLNLDPYAQPDPFDVVGPFLLLGLAALVVILGVRYLYEVEAMFRSGQTIGKRALKLRVIPLDPSLPLDRTMAFKRFLVQFVATSIVPGLNWIDGLWQLWDKPYRQCLHDKWAQTVVIKINA